MQTVIKKLQVTIGGVNGSGKSTAAKKLAEILDYTHYSSGDHVRNLAREAGYSSTTDFLAVKRGNDGDSKEFDEKVDSWIRDKELEEKIVMDSRLAFHWMPNSFKVFLTLNPRIAAERSFKDKNQLRKETENTVSLKEAMEDIIRRQANDVAFYKKAYGIDFLDKKNYDLVIDTGLPQYNGKSENVFRTIYFKYQSWLNNVG